MTSIASPDFGQMLRPQYRGLGGLRGGFQRPQLQAPPGGFNPQLAQMISGGGMGGPSPQMMPQQMVDPRQAFHQQQQQQHLAQLQMQQAMPRSDMLGQLRSLGAQIPLPQQAMIAPQIQPMSRPYGGGPGFAKPLSPNPGTQGQGGGAGGGAGGAPQEWKMSIEPMAGGGMIQGYQEGGWIEEQLVKLLMEALRENPRMDYGDASEIVEDLKREGEVSDDTEIFRALRPAWEKAQRLAVLDRARRGVGTKVERDVFGDLIPQAQDALLEPAPGMPTELPEEPLPMAYAAQRRRESDPLYGQFLGDPHTLGELWTTQGLGGDPPPTDYTGTDASKLLWDARYGLAGLSPRDLYGDISRHEERRGPVSPGTSVAHEILGEGPPPIREPEGYPYRNRQRDFIDSMGRRVAPPNAFIGQEDPPGTSVGQVDSTGVSVDQVDPDPFKQGGTEDTTRALIEFGKQRQAKLDDPLEAERKEIDRQIARYHRKLGDGDISRDEFQVAMDAIGASPEHVAEVFGWLGDPAPTRREVEPLVGDDMGVPIIPDEGLEYEYAPPRGDRPTQEDYDRMKAERADLLEVGPPPVDSLEGLEDQYLPSQHPMGRGTWLERGSDDLKEWAAKRNVTPDIVFQPATMFSERQIREMLDSRGLGKKDREERRAIVPPAVEDIYTDDGGYQDALGLTTDDPYESSLDLIPKLPEGFKLPYEEEEVSGPSWEGPLGDERRWPLDTFGEGISVEGLGDEYDELRLPTEYLDNMREAGVPADRAGEYLEHMAWLSRTNTERPGVDPRRRMYDRQYREDIDQKYGPTRQRDANSIFALAESLFGAPGSGNRWDRSYRGASVPTDPPDDHYLAGLFRDPGRWDESVRFGLGRSGGGIVGLAGGGHVPMIYANGGYIPGYGLGDWVKKWGGKALKGIGGLALKAAPIVAGAWNPLLGAGIGALISGIKNKSLKSALIGGATGYLGGKALGEGLKAVGMADQFGKFGATKGGSAFLKAFGAKPTAWQGAKALVGKGAGEMGKLALAGQFGKHALGAAADSPFVHSTVMPMIGQLAEEEARNKAAEEGLMYNSQLNPWSLGHEQGIGSQFAAGAGGGGRQAGAGAQQHMYSDGGSIDGYQSGGNMGGGYLNEKGEWVSTLGVPYLDKPNPWRFGQIEPYKYGTLDQPGGDWRWDWHKGEWVRDQIYDPRPGKVNVPGSSTWREKTHGAWWKPEEGSQYSNLYSGDTRKQWQVNWDDRKKYLNRMSEGMQAEFKQDEDLRERLGYFGNWDEAPESVIDQIPWHMMGRGSQYGETLTEAQQAAKDAQQAAAEAGPRVEPTGWLRGQFIRANPGAEGTNKQILEWAATTGTPNTEGGWEGGRGAGVGPDSDTSRPAPDPNAQFGGALPGDPGSTERLDGGDEGTYTAGTQDWRNRMPGTGPAPLGGLNQGQTTQTSTAGPVTPGAVAPSQLVEVANTPHENYRAGLQAQTAFATGEGDISGIDPYNMPTDPSEFEDPATQQWLQSLTPQSAQEGGPIDPSNTLIPSDSLMAEEPSPQIEELGRMALLGGIPEPERSNILQIIQEQYPDLYQQLTNELRTKESQSAGREGIVTEGFIPPFADGGLQSSGAVDDRLAVTKDDLVKEDFEERLAQGKNLQVAAAVAPYEYIVRKDDVFSTPEEVIIAAQQIDPETPAGPQVWDQLVGNLGEPDDQYA